MENKRYVEFARVMVEGKDTAITAAVSALRYDEPLPGAILLMQERLDSAPGALSTPEITSFLNDLRASELMHEVIEAVDRSRLESTREILLSSCWQSGLDYTQWLGRFVHYAISFGYMSALECYSVIEQWIEGAGESDRELWRSELQSAASTEEGDRSRLLHSIVSLI